jgi:hypothetical protein
MADKQDVKLLLITENAGLAKMAQEDKDCFAAIKLTDDFSVLNLRHICEEAFKTYGVVSIPADVRFVTVDEQLTEITGLLRDTYNVPGDSGIILRKFRNKHYMKLALEGSDVLMPKHVLFDPKQYTANADQYVKHIIDTLGLPIFAKPVDGGGGRGGAEIFNVQQLHKWCAEHLNAHNYELDTYLAGTYFHIDMIRQNGKIIFREVCQHSVPNYFAIRDLVPFGYLMLPHEDPTYQKLSAFADEVLTAMHPVPENAVYDLDCCITKEGKIYFVEIAARSPGGTNPQMYAEAYSGLNIEEAHVNLQLGFPMRPFSSNGLHCASFGIPREAGHVQKLQLPNFASKVSNVKWQARVGETYPRAAGMSDTYCTFVLSSPNPCTLITDYAVANRHKYSVVETPREQPANFFLKSYKPRLGMLASIGIASIGVAGLAVYLAKKCRPS